MNLFGMEKHHTKSMWLLAILIAFSTTVCAQGTSVTGRVSDEKGELLIGVSVQEKGTTNGDDAGVVRSVPTFAAFLDFSFSDTGLWMYEDSDSYLYAISPTSDEWFRMKI